MDDGLRGFFEDYAEASNSGDPLDLERFFADACMAAAPGFAACTPDREHLRDALVRMAAFYARVDRGPLRLDGLDEAPLGDHFTLATAHWRTTLGGDPEPVRFSVSYVVERPVGGAGGPSEAGPRIVCFIAHEDERLLVAEHGA